MKSLLIIVIVNCIHVVYGQSGTSLPTQLVQLRDSIGHEHVMLDKRLQRVNGEQRLKLEEEKASLASLKQQLEDEIERYAEPSAARQQQSREGSSLEVITGVRQKFHELLARIKSVEN